MRVLQLTYRVPFPPTDGGAIGIYNITKGLSDNGCDVDLLAINTPKHTQPKDAMQKYARQFDVFVNTSINPFKLLKNVLFSRVPYNVERFYDKEVIQKLKELLHNNSYDFIQLESAFVVLYIDEIRKNTSAPILVRTHNIEYIIWERLAKNERNVLKKIFYKHLAKRLKSFEATYYNQADALAVITEEDEKRLIDLKVNKPMRIIPAGVVLDNYLLRKIKSPKENTLFMIGALDWLPNIEGLNWFLNNVWEKLLELHPNIELHIAGKSTPEWLHTLNKKNIFVHGFVDDAVEFMQSYSLMLVPLLSGGGMRVKIIEGMAAGKCIISTSVGAEGIEVADGKNIILADNASDWAKAIHDLLNTPARIREIEEKAQQTAIDHYDNKTITGRYLELFESIKE